MSLIRSHATNSVYGSRDGREKMRRLTSNLWKGSGKRQTEEKGQQSLESTNLIPGWLDGVGTCVRTIEWSESH